MACAPERREDLVRLAQGRLEGPEADEVLDHALGCPLCGEELELLADLGQALAAGAFGERPRAAAARVFGGRRIAAAAAAILVTTAAFWLLFGPGTAFDLSGLADLTPVPFVEGTLRGPDGGPQDGREEGGAGDGAERLRAAMDAYNRGDHGAAAPLLARLLAEDPELHWLRIYLGVSSLYLARPDEAIEVLAPAAALGAGRAGRISERALWYTAMAHLLRSDAPRAIAALERVRDGGGGLSGRAERKLREVAAALGEAAAP
jgi:hypothetical protein